MAISDNSAGQIAVGESWAAVTLKSGSVLQLPLNWDGSLSGQATAITLPSGANDTPLGAAFWGDLLGFNPAHSANSFALINRDPEVFPVAGPSPAFPSNAPCWLAKVEEISGTPVTPRTIPSPSSSAQRRAACSTSPFRQGGSSLI